MQYRLLNYWQQSQQQKEKEGRGKDVSLPHKFSGEKDLLYAEEHFHGA